MDQLPTPGPSAGSEVRLILVGRLSPEKGIGGLLEALANLDARTRPHLVIVGDGPMRAELDQMVIRLGLTDQVTFLGRLAESETLEEIANSDALVLPSFMEGLPIVLMEAMALGKPVIASRVAGIPELVSDGENGLLFTPSNWQELTDKIALLSVDEELQGRLGAKGIERVADEFDIRKSAEKLTRLFRQAASSAATAAERPTAPVSDTSVVSTADRAVAAPTLRD